MKNDRRWLGWGALATPVALAIAISVFPVPFVRLAGCTGNLNGVEPLGAQLVIAEEVEMDGSAGPRFHVEKVTVFDAESGKTEGGPWVHELSGWVGILGDNYCVGGNGLLCASLKTGVPVVTRELLEVKQPLLRGHWLDDHDAYWLASPQQVGFKTNDGRWWALSAALELSESTEDALRRPNAPRATADDVTGAAFVGSGRRRLQVGAATSEKTWLEPAFAIDLRTGSAVRTPSGWLMTAIDKRDDAEYEGPAPEALTRIASVDAHGIETWTAVLGDRASVEGAWVFGGLVVLRSGGQTVRVQAIELATGKPRWARKYNLWPW